jgi:hypothetical protein
MHCDARALAVSGSRTEVEVRLWRSGTYRRPVQLAGGDRLVAEVAGRRYEMTQPESLEGTGRYQAVAPGSGAETPVSLLLLRPDGTSTTVVSGALPMPLELADVPHAPSASRGLDLRWSPAGGDPIEIVAQGPCISTTTDWLSEDVGRFVLPPGTLRPPVFGSDACWVDLSVARTREGRVERGVHPGSSFLVRQVRTVRLKPVR